MELYKPRLPHPFFSAIHKDTPPHRHEQAGSGKGGIVRSE
jgi:hypothetical protein